MDLLLAGGFRRGFCKEVTLGPRPKGESELTGRRGKGRELLGEEAGLAEALGWEDRATSRRAGASPGPGGVAAGMAGARPGSSERLLEKLSNHWALVCAGKNGPFGRLGTTCEGSRPLPSGGGDGTRTDTLTLGDLHKTELY